ncbi:MAG: cold shock protein [Frankiales bacterium]|nr:cold shock protein [Frankiales bacterium]MDX6207729.1 cold shock protein [Frankiales bacterium]
MPTGKVKWYDPAKGFGFLSQDGGDDVYVHKSVLPAGVEEVKPGQRVEFGIAQGKRGEQALSVRILDPLPSVARATAAANRREPDELHGMIEDMVKVLDTAIQGDLRKGRYPDRKVARKIAEIMRSIAAELEA